MDMHLWARAFRLDTLGVCMEYFAQYFALAALTSTTPSLLSVTQFSSIAAALAVVHELRMKQEEQPALQHAVLAIKRAQCHRFEHSYSDVLAHPDWGPAALFFLQELYGDRDFSQRDAQFGRIAPAMQRLFPQAVFAVATTLSQLHAVSEQLDHAMGSALVSASQAPFTEAGALKAYVRTWRAVGQPAARNEQLVLVELLGAELARLTRLPGLRMMLRMMRGPAAAAGLDQLQLFLERGFDTFAAMQRSKSGVAGFLTLVDEREKAWMTRLFDASMTNTDDTLLWPELE
jgi:hypothetical protein